MFMIVELITRRASYNLCESMCMVLRYLSSASDVFHASESDGDEIASSGGESDESGTAVASGWE